MKELEKKWFRYKLKQSIPWFILMFYLILIGVYINYKIIVDKFVINQYNQLSKQYFAQKDTSLEIHPKISTITDVNKSNVLIIKDINKTIIDINTSNEIFDINDTLYEENISEPFFSEISPSIDIEVPKVKTQDEILEEEIEKRHKKQYIYIKKSSKEYKDVEKRFSLSQDPEDALFLARIYYEKKNYKKAEEWAFIANELNDDSEDSWLIYAKAKNARGQKAKAIHILKSYLRKSNSLRAKKLLEKFIKN
jgi:tetratricopeptide (TPR) repeat protein